MFKVNPDGMRMEPTPERVLSVCRLIAHKSMTREEVRRVMHLGANSEEEVELIDKSIAVALEELSIIKADDDKLILAVDPDIIASTTSFRRYVLKDELPRSIGTQYAIGDQWRNNPRKK